MDFSQALIFAQKKFEQKEIKSAAIDSLLLLIQATSLSKEAIIFNPNHKLSDSQKESFLHFVARREAREPISHIINKREFFGLDFFVNRDVLDPRPDSENLIELILNKFQNYKNSPIKILELGIGSGCLSISLLKNLPQASIIGVDISPKALAICDKNAKNHAVSERLELMESNLFMNLPLQKFDLIISNPPYISKGDIENLEDEVKFFEPIIALDGGVDGLDFYYEIAKNVKKFLKEDGNIVIEIGINQAMEVQEIFDKQGFELNEIKLDLAGIERILHFKLKNI